MLRLYEFVRKNIIVLLIFFIAICYSSSTLASSLLFHSAYTILNGLMKIGSILMSFGLFALITYLFIHYFWRRKYKVSKNEPVNMTALHPTNPLLASPRLIDEDGASGEVELEDQNPLNTFFATIHIFGYLEPEIRIHLQSSMKEIFISKDKKLPINRDNFYVIIKGEVQVCSVTPQYSSLQNAIRTLESSQYCTCPGEEQVIVLNRIGPRGVASSLFDVLSILAGSEQESTDRGEFHLKACCNTSILCIPGSAFAQLRELFPRAASHIVQVILARFQRVTFLTLHQYLGLASESMAVDRLFSDEQQNDSLIADNKVDIYLQKMFGIKKSLKYEDLEVKAGESLVVQGKRNPGLYILMKGKLIVYSQPKEEEESVNGVNEDKRTILAEISGQEKVVGIMAALIGSISIVTVEAIEDSKVIFIKREYLKEGIDENPAFLLKVSSSLLNILPPFIKAIDLALEWRHLRSGEVLIEEGSVMNGIFIVLHGKLKFFQEKEGIVEEFGVGDSIGETEVLAGMKCGGTIYASRDTEVACLPKLLFEALAIVHPSVCLNISKTVALKSASHHFNSKSEIKRNKTNIKTVAIMPHDTSLYEICLEFAQKLSAELSSMERTLYLDGTIALEQLGKHAFTAFGKLKMIEWLNEIETDYRIILFVVDPIVRSKWTRYCLRQADALLVVGHSECKPDLGDYERLLLCDLGIPLTHKELIIIHPRPQNRPGIAQNWLKNRPWITRHHHIYLAGGGKGGVRGLGPKSDPLHYPILGTIHRQLKRYGVGDLAAVTEFCLGPSIPRPSLASIMALVSTDDFGRLARYILGQSIGLVLGGGGARGLAHVGVIQALLEAKIPIDSVGGTSIGALMSALYARETDYYQATGFAKIFAGRIGSKWRQLLDLTYPLTSWFTGHSFNRSIWKLFGDIQIEDLWLPYYCVTTDICHSKMMVHRSGSVWRYVRASMSLCGILPPLCDEGKYLLVDGGYMDNVPVDIMANDPSISTILAVDVGSEDSTEFTDYGDTLSGWWLLLQRLLGRHHQLHIPTLPEIQSRLAYVNCISKLEQLKSDAKAQRRNIFYLRPPVEHYGILDFGLYDEIVRCGYEYGKGVAEAWKKDDGINNVLFMKSKSMRQPVQSTRCTNLHDHTTCTSAQESSHQRRLSI